MGSKTLKTSRWLILSLLLAWLAAPAFGAGGAAPAKPGTETAKNEFPLHITAARLEADQNKGIVIFSGKVKADYGESTLYSDKLLVYFKPKPEAAKGQAGAPGAPASPAPPAPQATPGAAAATAAPAENQGPLGDLGGEKIDHIVALGQVRFVQGDRVATGKQAVYYQDKDEVVLTGNPQLWRAENTLKGERIIFNLKTDQMKVESSPRQRVEAVLYTQSGTEGKETKTIGPLAPKPRKGPKR
jgi:lipopolysaccharide export system protein LptA